MGQRDTEEGMEMGVWGIRFWLAMNKEETRCHVLALYPYKPIQATTIPENTAVVM